jgi:hypothetical protein
MPRYIIERDITGASLDDVKAGAQRAMEAAATMDGIRWIRSYVSAVEGKIYCEYEAPSPEAVREHAERAHIGCYRVSEISADLEPSMFV